MTMAIATQSNWTEVPVPDALRHVLAPGSRVFQRNLEDGHLSVILSRESTGWHLSISHRRSIVDPFTGRPAAGRYPTWDEIRDARYDLLPDDLTMAMMLPPRAEYVNLHSTTFHLFEVES
jgi:hypothetical protein